MQTKSSSKLLWIGLGISLVLVISALIFVSMRSRSYELVSLKRAPIKEAIYGIGTVQAEHRFNFKLGLTRTIEAQYVREGDSVEKGQKLVKLSEGPIVISPLKGTVTLLPYRVGENAFADSPIVTVEDLQDRSILASLEQQGALRVKKDLNVRLNFESIRNQVFKGKVRSVYPRAGQFFAVIDVEKLSPEIVPGMTADVAIEVAEKADALLIPIRSLSVGQVTVMRSGHRMKVPVEVGSMDAEWAEVVKGDLKDSDQVVVPKK